MKVGNRHQMQTSKAYPQPYTDICLDDMTVESDMQLIFVPNDLSQGKYLPFILTLLKPLTKYM